MKRIIITLSLLLLTACQTTTLEKAQIASSALIVNKNYSEVYEVVSDMVLTEAQIDNVIAINSVYQLANLILSGNSTLSRLEAIAEFERGYAEAKTAYIEVRKSIDLDQLTPLQKFDLRQFDTAIAILAKEITKLSKSESLDDRKAALYELVELLRLSLQIVELTK